MQLIKENATYHLGELISRSLLISICNMGLTTETINVYICIYLAIIVKCGAYSIYKTVAPFTTRAGQRDLHSKID